MNSNDKKSFQLGMPHGTATNKLRKLIIFSLIKQLGFDVCYQCGQKIEDISQLSIEHIVPYLDSENPKELFFDLNNIAFSHLSCNVKASRQTRPLKHPIQESYKRGCRCEECKNIQKERTKKQRNIKKLCYI